MLLNNGNEKTAANISPWHFILQCSILKNQKIFIFIIVIFTAAILLFDCIHFDSYDDVRKHQWLELNKFCFLLDQISFYFYWMRFPFLWSVPYHSSFFSHTTGSIFWNLWKNYFLFVWYTSVITAEKAHHIYNKCTLLYICIIYMYMLYIITLYTLCIYYLHICIICIYVYIIYI